VAAPDPTAARRVRIVLSVLVLAATVAVLWGLDHRGRSARVFAAEKVVLEVERPDQVFDVWSARGVRGRTLLLFGPFPHPWRSSEGAHAHGPDSFVTRAALENLVRRIYVLVPDHLWDEEFGVPRPGFFRSVPGLAQGYYMHYPLGLPVIATTPSSLPELGEPALVYVDRSRFHPGAVQRFLARAGVRFDVLVTSKGL
jgi:hypothetical protein